MPLRTGLAARPNHPTLDQPLCEVDDRTVQLQELARHIGGSMATLNGQLGRLRSTWRDQEFDKFAAIVAKTQVRLQAFIIEAERSVSSLRSDAAATSEYQRVQVPE
jgi:hypothetical protein